MKKIYILALSFIALIACMKESHLTIHNDTTQMTEVRIDGEIFTMLNLCEPINIPYYLNSYLIFLEKKNMPIEYVGSLFVNPESFSVILKPGKDKEFHIVQNRAGLNIINASFTVIDQILMRVDSTSSWSEDLLGGCIYEQDLATIPVMAEYKYLKVIDAFGMEYQQIEIEMNAGEYVDYVFTGD